MLELTSLTGLHSLADHMLSIEQGGTGSVVIYNETKVKVEEPYKVSYQEEDYKVKLDEDYD